MINLCYLFYSARPVGDINIMLMNFLMVAK